MIIIIKIIKIGVYIYIYIVAHLGNSSPRALRGSDFSRFGVEGCRSYYLTFWVSSFRDRAEGVVALM